MSADDTAALIAAWDNNNDGHDIEATVRAGCALREALESATDKDSLTVRTMEDLEALPVDSLIRSEMGGVVCKKLATNRWWALNGGTKSLLPASVLWIPVAS